MALTGATRKSSWLVTTSGTKAFCHGCCLLCVLASVILSIHNARELQSNESMMRFIQSRNIDGNQIPTHPNLANLKTAYQEEDLPAAVMEYCNLTGVDHWMVPENDWRRRTPAFLIIGAKKAGTTGLFLTMIKHPSIVMGKKKELQFFNTLQFNFWEDNEIGGRVNVAQAREALFPMFQKDLLQHNKSLITGEATPEYLLYPDICGKEILCTIPWVKVIVIIREPIERLYSHYNYLRDPTKKFPANYNRSLLPFEQYVKSDIKRLQRQGILPSNLAQIEDHMRTKDHTKEFLKFQRSRGSKGERAVIRSMYAFQLEGWDRMLRQFGKDPKEDLRVVISSETKESTKVTNDLFEWLGLEPVDHVPRVSMVTKYTSPPIRPAFKAYLNSIFAPFNKRLYQFLGDGYEGIFDTA